MLQLETPSRPIFCPRGAAWWLLSARAMASLIRAGCLSFSGLFSIFQTTVFFFHFVHPSPADRSWFLRVLVAFLHCVSGCCLATVFPSGSCLGVRLAAVWLQFCCLAAVLLSGGWLAAGRLSDGCLNAVFLSGSCLAAVWQLSGACLAACGCSFAVWVFSGCCFPVWLLACGCFPAWLLYGCCRGAVLFSLFLSFFLSEK